MKKTFFAIPMIITGMLTVSTAANASSYTNTNYCREYTRTIYVGGQPQQGYGTACQQPDGSWEIVSGDNVGQTVAPTYIIEQPIVYYQEPVRNTYRTHYYTPPSYTSLNVSFGGNDWDRHRGHGWRGKGHGYGHRDDYHHRHTRRSGSRISWR